MSNKLKHFEVSLYNRQVRELDEKNRDHPNFSRDWAHLHFLNYEGENEQDVIAQVHKKYPERKGFVIDRIVEMKEYEFVRPPGRRF